MSRVMSVATILLTTATWPASPAAGQSVPHLTAEQWREDLRHYATQLPQVHKNLYHTLTPRQFAAAVEALDRRLPELADHEVIVELARITAMIGDGHTRLWLTPTTRNGFHQVPVLLYWLHDGLYVLGAPVAHRAAVGGRVERIGSVSAEEAWDRVAPLVQRDNAMTVTSIAPRYLAIPEVLHALGLTEQVDRVRYVVRDSAGRDHALDLEAIPDAHLGNLSNRPYLLPRPTDQLRLVMANHGTGELPLWLQDPGSTFWYRWLADSRTLYVQLNAIRNTDDETLAAFFERVYADADRLRPDRLVLDLRHNGGGNNMLNLPVVHGIIRRTWLDRRGGVFVLIGRHTFSAASHLVTYLERHTNAVFVGEPTGGSPNHFGDARPVDLPHSGLRIGASSIYWQNSLPREFDARDWTPPDVAVEMSIADYRANRDPVLAAALEWTPQPPLAQRLRNALSRGGPADATAVYRAFRADPHNAYATREADLNRLGYELLEADRPPDAVVIFALNAEGNPRSANAFDSLGDGYLALGDTTRAIASYRKALEIEPMFAASAANLRRLTGR